MTSYHSVRRLGLSRFIHALGIVIVLAGSAVAEDRMLPLDYSKLPEGMRSQVPLPFGISLNYCYLSEKLRIRDLDISANGQPIPPGLVEIRTINQQTQTETARADVWPFSFLNLYGIGGHVHGTAYNFDIAMSPMLPLKNLLPSDLSVDYSGAVYGVGGILGSGYGPFFLCYDVNYTWTDINKLDTKVRTLVQSIRARYRTEALGYMVSLYGGTSNEGIKATQMGSITLGGTNLEYSLKARANTPWNALAGTQVEFSPNWVLYLEGGFMGRRQALASLGFRF